MEISRKKYVDLFGPTTGDKIRLGDTEIIIEIERDLLGYGDESVFGGGKSIRDGLAQSTGVARDDSVDTVITNVVIMDPVLGIIKADIGIKDGRIVKIGDRKSTRLNSSH